MWFDIITVLWEEQNQINFQQDRQCTYNVTLRYVRTTIVVAEKQY